jgi:hypothetical protein
LFLQIFKNFNFFIVYNINNKIYQWIRLYLVQKLKLFFTYNCDSIEFLSYTVSLISIVGFGFYFNRQYTEHSDSFDMITFIFGKNKFDKM